MSIRSSQLVNGALLVTESDHTALGEAIAADDVYRVRDILAPIWDQVGPEAYAGIPLVVVPANGQPIDLGGGKKAFVGTDGAIYVMDTTKLPAVRHGVLALLRGGRNA